MLSRTLVLEDESLPHFLRLHDQHVARFCPTDDVELAIVEELSATVWRIRRSWAIETRLLNNAADAHADAAGDALDSLSNAFAACAQSPALPLLHRYQARLHGIYARALKNLLLIRTAAPLQPGYTCPLPAAPPSPALEPVVEDPPVASALTAEVPPLSPPPFPPIPPAPPANYQTNLNVLCNQEPWPANPAIVIAFPSPHS